MAKCDLAIEFERSDRRYRPGETVSGKVTVQVNAKVQCNGLTVKRLWHTHGKGNYAEGSDSVEEVVFSGEWWPGETHAYPFAFEVPAAPVSYHGEVLNVDHYVAARADIPWAIDPKAEEDFLLLAGPESCQIPTEVSEAMQSLAMAGGRFEVALLPEPDGSAHGRERVEFLVAGSPGQPLRPLGKVASGGELSRIGLAIQVIASSAGAAPTLIFDEVDVGIGGRVAEIVGQMLRRLGQSRQVLCVTHLPQVAAQADWQWSIAKEVRDGETLSAVHPLDDAGRVEEIARMLGGVQITRTTREHADEMLSRRD